MDSLPLAEVKNGFSEVVDRVTSTHQRVTVTRNGRPVVVLLAVEDLEALEETVAVLSDAATMQRLEQAHEAKATGDIVDEDAFRSRHAHLLKQE
jgi:prevent-host-death family protein